MSSELIQFFKDRIMAQELVVDMAQEQLFTLQQGLREIVTGIPTVHEETSDCFACATGDCDSDMLDTLCEPVSIEQFMASRPVTVSPEATQWERDYFANYDQAVTEAV